MNQTQCRSDHPTALPTTARQRQHAFLLLLDNFIQATSRMEKFNGQSQAIRALRRIRTLAVFQ